jgi:hypothetical protein
MDIRMFFRKVKKQEVKKVCEECECPIVGKDTMCPSCRVRMNPDAVFVECECGVVIENPTAKQEASGLDDDGEWHCPKCR